MFVNLFVTVSSVKLLFCAADMFHSDRHILAGIMSCLKQQHTQRHHTALEFRQSFPTKFPSVADNLQLSYFICQLSRGYFSDLSQKYLKLLHDAKTRKLKFWFNIFTQSHWPSGLRSCTPLSTQNFAI